MERREKFGMISADYTLSKGVSEVTHVTSRDSDLQRMLDKYQGHEEDFALTFGVRVAKDGPDGSTKAGNGHALTVVKITDSTVYVSNPWYPDKIEPIPRDEFERMATGFTATPMNENKVAGTYMANALNDIGNGVNSQEADVLRESLNRLLASRDNIKLQFNTGITYLSTERVMAYLNAYNANNPKTPLNASGLLRRLNNAAKMDLSKEQLNCLNRLFAQLGSDEKFKISAKDVEILQSLSNRKS